MTAVDERSIGAALQAAEKELAAAEQSHGKDSCQICVPLGQLAALYYQDGLYAKAELLYRRAVDLWAQAGEQGASQLIDALDRLAAIYRAQSKLDDAESVYLRLLSAIPADDEHALSRAERSCCLAGVYFAKGSLSQCEEMLKQACALFETACGPQSYRCRLVFMALAAVCMKQGKNGEADEYFEKSRTLTGSNDETAHAQHALIDLCQTYYAQGRVAEIEILVYGALLTDDERLWPEHPRVAEMLFDRGELFRAQSSWTDAEDCFKRALVIRQKMVASNNAELGNNAFSLALLYLGQKRYQDAEPALKLALKTRVSVFGVEHPSVAAGIETFACLLRATKRGALATKLDARARDIRSALVAAADRAANANRPAV